jgi:hypothetical protein
MNDTTDTTDTTDRKDVLAAMTAASNVFYAIAVRAGCHAFVEFNGLMTEYIKLCEQAEQRGEDWTLANIHNNNHLKIPAHSLNYINEKLECIYGLQLETRAKR